MKRNTFSKKSDIINLAEIVEKLKADGKKIVATGGVFDILHPGHIRVLREAKKFGDILIVGINSDKSVKEIKGESRPINSESDRLEMVSSFSIVDFAIIFDEETPVKFIAEIKPDTWVKGGEYRNKHIPEEEIILKIGATIRYIEMLPGYSTSSLIARLRKIPEYSL